MMPQILANHEITSSAWRKLKEHIEERIAHLRKRNDGDLTERETAHVRGQIFAMKNLLDQAEPPPGLVTAGFDDE